MKVGGQRKLTVPAKVRLLLQKSKFKDMKVLEYKTAKWQRYNLVFIRSSSISLDTGPEAVLLRSPLMLFSSLTSNSWPSNKSLEKITECCVDTFSINATLMYPKITILIVYLHIWYFTSRCIGCPPLWYLFLPLQPCIWYLSSYLEFNFWECTGWVPCHLVFALHLVFGTFTRLCTQVLGICCSLWYLVFGLLSWICNFTWGCTGWAFGLPSDIYRAWTPSSGSVT